jgi:branched-chain amino acid transport system permease protein
VRGVAFAMVTLAFAEAFHVFVEADPARISGGEEGLSLASGQVPDVLTGVVNTRWVYWLALAFALVTFAVCRQAVASRAGRVWQAIRDNEDRVELLGLIPFQFKLLSFGLSAMLAATGGAVYLLLVRGATPSAASVVLTLNLIIMVVLGGLSRLWGAALGGLVFGYLQLRLPGLARSGVFDPLPGWLEGPLTEPLFILGVLFVVLIMFSPGGLASLFERLGRALRGGTRHD